MKYSRAWLLLQTNTDASRGPWQACGLLVEFRQRPPIHLLYLYLAVMSAQSLFRPSILGVESGRLASLAALAQGFDAVF